MATFLLVHGAWHGAWCWKRLIAPLRAAGHEPYSFDLTGLGSRRHHARPDIGLETHVTDLLAVVEAEELPSPIIVAHSYAGIVATVAAAREPSLFSRIIYLDTFIPAPGQALFDLIPADERDRLRAVAATHSPTWLLPPFAPQGYGVDAPDDVAWLQRRLVPMPIKCFEDRAEFEPRRLDGLRRAYVRASRPDRDRFARFAAQFRDRADVGYYEIPSGHDMMITHPAETCAALHAEATR